MFKWLFEKPKRDNDRLREMMSAAAEGHNKAALRSAISTIVPKRREESDNVQFCAWCASELAKAVWSKATVTRDDDDEFVAAIFALVAANHFSYKLAAQFEMSSALAVLMVARNPLDPEGAGALTREAINTHNKLAERDDKALLAVGQNVAQWMATPSLEQLNRLVALFKIFRENIS